MTLPLTTPMTLALEFQGPSLKNSFISGMEGKFNIFIVIHLFIYFYFSFLLFTNDISQFTTAGC